MKKILVVDPLCEFGHIKINSKFLKTITSQYDTTFYTEFTYVSKLNLNNLNLDIKYFKLRTNNLIFKNLPRIRQLLYLYEVFKFYKNGDYKAILFLSYETISMFIITRFFKVKNLILFEHNNIDQTINSKIKYFCYTNLPVNTISFVFEDYIKKYIEKISKRQSFIINHPIFFEKRKIINNYSINNIIIFSPSSTYDTKIIDGLVNYCKINNLQLYLKGNKASNNKNIIISKYFENYEDIMNLSNIIMISNMFNYRVSGVFYEAMSLSKKIIGVKTLFLTKMKEEYPNSILLFDSIDKININNKFILQNNNDDIEKFFKKHKKYEDSLILSLEKIINKTEGAK